LPWSGVRQSLGARLGTTLTPPAFLAKAVFALAQLLPCPLADVDAADGGDAQDFALRIFEAQKFGHAVGPPAGASSVGFLKNALGLLFRYFAAHPAGGVLESPNRIG
jgi:hypothetical protein